MLLVGLTGGIGAGKSTVAAMLERRGAVIIDADDLARQAVLPGTAGHGRVLERFGPEVLSQDGGVDRQTLATRVFGDRRALRDLEAITHPEVARLFQEAIEPFRGTDRIVVYVVPLLVEEALAPGFDSVVVVSARPETRTARLTEGRGMTAEDVSRRMNAQLSDEERERAADVTIRNDGSLEDLERQVDQLWATLRGRAEAASHGR